MPSPDRYEIGLSWVVAKNGKCSHFWGGVPNISHKIRDNIKIVIWGTGIAALGLRWGPQWSDLVDMPISDRYEIGCSQKKVSRVIFGMKYLILAMKIEMP